MSKAMVLAITVTIFVLSGIALAAGNIEKGKTLFNDPKFAGATSGRSCNTCHPGGSGLEQAGSRKEFHVAGMTQKSLEEAVNACIEYAINGNPIGPGSGEMQDIVAYIKSLKKQ